MTAFPPGYDASAPYGVAYTPPPPPANKPRIWTVFVAFIAAFGPGCIGAGIVAVVMTAILHGPEALNTAEPGGQERLEAAILEPPIFLPVLATTQVVLAAVALGAAYFSPTPLRKRLRLVRPALPWYGYAVVAVGTLALGFTSGILIEMLGFGDVGVLKEFERAMTGLRGGVLLAAAAVIGLAPGFGEELLFRGYMQTRLRQRWPRLLALLVTSLFFGLLHFDLVQSTMAIGLGLWLGEVADRTGSIWPSIVGHAFNNGVATIMSALLSEAGDATETWSTLVVTVPVFALCLVYVLRRPVVGIEPDPAPVPTPPAAPFTSPFYMPPPTAPGAS